MTPLALAREREKARRNRRQRRLSDMALSYTYRSCLASSLCPKRAFLVPAHVHPGDAWPSRARRFPAAHRSPRRRVRVASVSRACRAAVAPVSRPCGAPVASQAHPRRFGGASAQKPRRRFNSRNVHRVSPTPVDRPDSPHAGTAGSRMSLTSSLSIRRPSRSTTSNRQPCSTNDSPSAGRCRNAASASPATVA